LRDAVTFIDGDLGKPTRIFRRDVELGRFNASVRFDDAFRQRLAAKARDQISDNALGMRRGRQRNTIVWLAAHEERTHPDTQ
jgi:hypothetical protein